MRVGCNSTHVADFMTKMGIGRGHGVTRVYAVGQAWSSSTFDAARSAAARGDMLLLSVKPAVSWGSEPNSAAERTRITGIATGAAGLGVPVGFALNHEPENDGGVMADFINMQKWFINLVNPILHPAGGKSAICLMDASRPQWLGDARPDIFATDIYMWRGAQTSKPWANPTIPAKLDLYLAHLDYCKAHGFEPQLWEFGCARTQADSAGTERASNISMLSNHARAKEYTAIAHFELNAGESGAIINWAIRDEAASRTAFMKFDSAVTPPPPPPPGPCEDELAAALAHVASLESDLAAADALLATSQAMLATTKQERDDLQVKITNAQAALA